MDVECTAHSVQNGKFHKTRVRDILDTWYEDAKEEVYFFTDSDDDYLKSRLSTDHLIQTNCSEGHDRKSLCCKMAYELLFFTTTNARWSCHFDDDNYVNINSLKGFLKTIDASRPFYIGKSSTRQPLIVSSIDGGKIFIRFATGGAGFCLSQSLLNSLRDSSMDSRFDALCEKYMLPDDVTIGHIITNLLRVPLTEVQEFHSHLENLNHLSAAEIRDQISFGGMTSLSNFLEVDLPQLNGSGPLRFYDLHVYLKTSNMI